MTVALIGITQPYIGTHAERLAMSVTGLKAGYKFGESDTGICYMLDGTGAWVVDPFVDAGALRALIGTPAGASVSADIAGIKTQTDKTPKLISKPVAFWSDPQLALTVTTPAGTLTMPSVVVAGLPAGAIVTHAKAIVMSRVIMNDSVATNYLDGATVAVTSQVIQIKKGGGAWVDAITFLNTQLSIAGTTREGGPVLACSIDLSGTITGNDTYSFQWLLAKALAADLYLQGVHVLIQLDYTV